MLETMRDSLLSRTRADGSPMAYISLLCEVTLVTMHNTAHTNLQLFEGFFNEIH